MRKQSEVEESSAEKQKTVFVVFGIGSMKGQFHVLRRASTI